MSGQVVGETFICLSLGPVGNFCIPCRYRRESNKIDVIPAGGKGNVKKTRKKARDPRTCRGVAEKERKIKGLVHDVVENSKEKRGRLVKVLKRDQGKKKRMREGKRKTERESVSVGICVKVSVCNP